VIGAAAGTESFTHVHDVAAANGQPGWLAWADAVVLELMSVASGLELRRRKRLHAPLTFPAVVLGVAVALSLSAQVVEAERSAIGWTAAAIPALGFLVMVKIALAQAPMPSPPAENMPDPVQPPEPPAPDPPQQVSATVVVIDDVALLPAARRASAALDGRGERVSRHALATALRADGHAITTPARPPCSGCSRRNATTASGPRRPIEHSGPDHERRRRCQPPVEPPELLRPLGRHLRPRKPGRPPRDPRSPSVVEERLPTLGHRSAGGVGVPGSVPPATWVVALAVVVVVVMFVVPVRCAAPTSKAPFPGCKYHPHGLLGRCRHHGRRPGLRVIAIFGGDGLLRRRTCDKCGQARVFLRFEDSGRPYLGCSGFPRCKNPRSLGGYRF
jgi:hypothetical protein